MGARKVFTYASNLLGLNFVDVPASYVFIVVVQAYAIISGFYFTFYTKISSWREFPKDIYFAIDCFQQEFLYLLQITFVVRALLKWRLQKKISDTINFEFNTRNDSCERNMFFGFLFLVLTRVMKWAMSDSFATFKYMIKATFSELTLATNDLMFVFYISKLTAHLRYVREKIQTKATTGVFLKEQRELLTNFSVKRAINQRYALEIFLTVSYNFVHLIISLYYIFMRIRFNHLNSLYRKSSKTFKSFGKFFDDFIL